MTDDQHSASSDEHLRDARWVFPARYSPAGFSVLAIVAAALSSWWWMASIPFIWLGSVCAQPNLNLADGCLSYVAAGIGLIVLLFHPALGQAIFAGVICGYMAGFIEKLITMKPISKDKPLP